MGVTAAWENNDTFPSKRKTFSPSGMPTRRFAEEGASYRPKAARLPTFGRARDPLTVMNATRYSFHKAIIIFRSMEYEPREGVEDVLHS